MIERVRHDRLDDRNVIHVFGEVRKEFRKLDSRFALLGKLEFRSHQPRVGIDERGAITLQEFRRRQRAIKLSELRLVIKQLQMAGCARHEEEDDTLGLGGKRRSFGSERVELSRVGITALGQQLGEGDRPQTHAALFHEPAPGHFLGAEISIKMI